MSALPTAPLPVVSRWNDVPRLQCYNSQRRSSFLHHACTRAAAVQTAALCCEAMVATEVAKVKAETEEAMRRLCEERDNAVQQVAELNTRLRDVEMICERLTEENVSGPCFF